MATESQPETHFGLTYIATGDDTDGQYFQCSATIPAGDSGPPVHKHANESEGFYVASGTLTIKIDGQTRTLNEGDYVNVRPGQAHTWSNQSQRSTLLIITFSPAGIENMFRELDNQSADFATVGHKFGMTILNDK